MSGLPESWAWATIGEICWGPQYGWTTKSSLDSKGYLYLRTTDITRGHIDWTRVPRCREDPPSPDVFLLEDGDIVVSRAGSVGASALVRTPPPAVFASYLIRLRVVPPADPAYLRYFLQSAAYWQQISDAKVGIAVQNVNATKLAAIALPVPPPPEQERIVTVIEEQLSRLDAAEGTVRSAEHRMNALESSIITQTSSTLDPPQHWKVATVADAGSVGLGLQRSPKRHSGPNMRPYLRVANVFEDRIDDSDVMSMDMTDAEWERFKLRDGDVLLNEGQSPELLGRPAIYRGDPPDVAFTNSLIRFRASDEVDPEWALLVFRSHMHNRRFMRESQITTNIAHLAAGRFKTVEFPIPPFEEQRARVAEARGRLEACSRLRSEVATARKRAGTLRRSILAAAFLGHLVPQDPHDEPASVLLERIGAERGAVTGNKRARTARTS
ncbi:MAG TPA: restriction endonuclease subunit S [Fimbriimonadaceae bacterium]|nr:restriction endonuclease subunit S [Fimbriimonadaceae bacterium]